LTQKTAVYYHFKMKLIVVFYRMATVVL